MDSLPFRVVTLGIGFNGASQTGTGWVIVCVSMFLYLSESTAVLPVFLSEVFVKRRLDACLSAQEEVRFRQKPLQFIATLFWVLLMAGHRVTFILVLKSVCGSVQLTLIV